MSFLIIMQIEDKKKLYQNFHKERKLQKKIINDNNFTYRELIKRIKPYLGECHNILDIGCGVGTMDFYLAKKGKNVTGIEISANAVSIARENAKLFNLYKNINFVISKFPNKALKGKYDLVIFSEVIEHLEDDNRALRDIHKILKRNGLLVITTPSKNAPLYRLGLLNKFDRSVGHLRRYSVNDLLSLVKNNQYKIINFGRHEGILKNFLFTNSVASKMLRFIRWRMSDIVTFVDNITVLLFGESNLWVVARKI
jgi:SAM-dependent methyltransferase